MRNRKRRQCAPGAAAKRNKSSRVCARQNTFRHSVWPTDITRPSPGGYSRGGGRGEEAELEDERSGGRFRRQPRRLPTDGRRDACLHSDCRAQGTSSRDLRRETKQFEDGIQLMHLNYLLAFDGIIASRGGIPLIDQGVIIGAIGCSGGTDSQDEIVRKAGAAVINQPPARNK